MSAIDSILAIDAASRTGWAFLDTDQSIMSGYMDFTGEDGQAGVLDLYQRWFARTMNELKPAVVAYEIPPIGLSNRVSNQTTRILLGGLHGITQIFLYRNDILMIEVQPSEAKKAVTGKGNASKSEVMRAVNAKGFDVANTDQADAVAILLASMVKLDIDTPHLFKAVS